MHGFDSGFGHSGFDHGGFGHSGGFGHNDGFGHSGLGHADITQNGFSHAGFSNTHNHDLHTHHFNSNGLHDQMNNHNARMMEDMQRHTYDSPARRHHKAFNDAANVPTNRGLFSFGGIFRTHDDYSDKAMRRAVQRGINLGASEHGDTLPETNKQHKRRATKNKNHLPAIDELRQTTKPETEYGRLPKKSNPVTTDARQRHPHNPQDAANCCVIM